MLLRGLCNALVLAFGDSGAGLTRILGFSPGKKLDIGEGDISKEGRNDGFEGSVVGDGLAIFVEGLSAGNELTADDGLVENAGEEAILDGPTLGGTNALILADGTLEGCPGSIEDSKVLGELSGLLATEALGTGTRLTGDDGDTAGERSTEEAGR